MNQLLLTLIVLATCCLTSGTESGGVGKHTDVTSGGTAEVDGKDGGANDGAGGQVHGGADVVGRGEDCTATGSDAILADVDGIATTIDGSKKQQKKKKNKDKKDKKGTTQETKKKTKTKNNTKKKTKTETKHKKSSTKKKRKNKEKRDFDLGWYAPFLSVGGYASEAIAFVTALDTTTLNLQITMHGDSPNADFIDGLPDEAYVFLF